LGSIPDIHEGEFMDSGSLYRFSAFSNSPAGGNPAGVWIGDTLPAPNVMLQLVWRERSDVFHSRNPFPVGGVIEDPATGAAAAALGGYLREAKLVAVPTTIHIRQGEAMGRPSRLTVEIPATGGIVVTGTAIPIEME
jgi:predicted PhzF superfamily epimerase YddE/YHI9